MEFLKKAGLAILDVILPERDRAARIRKRSIRDFSLMPTEHSLLSEKITTLLDYKDPAVSDLIRALKYEHSGQAARLSAEALSDYLREELSSMRTFSVRKILLVPMPLHASRLRERGFNQMEKVFSYLPQEFKDGTLSSIEQEAIRRIKKTPQQSRLSRAERLTNVSEAFEAHPFIFDNTHVILIDDVTTTGATLSSAGKVLRKVGAKVSLIALARA